MVPPLDFPDRSFDCVISFQVIEHIKRDAEFVREIHRVLRPGGRFIVTTPNAPMSLTRNPWHVREYTAEQLRRLLAARFSEIETLGVFGNEKVMDYYAENRRGVERITRFDILDLQHRLPRWMLQIPYDILNRMNRRKLLRENTGLTTSIRMDDYRIEPVGDGCFLRTTSRPSCVTATSIPFAARRTSMSNAEPKARTLRRFMRSHAAGRRGVRVNDRNPVGRIPNTPSVRMRQ